MNGKRLSVWAMMLIGTAAYIGTAQDDVMSDRAELMRGVALPSQQVVLNAPVDGVVKSIAVDEGDRVKAERLLAAMDDQLQTAAVEAAKLAADAKAGLRRAQLELDEARIKLERMAEAAEKGAAEEWEVRQAKLQRDLAEAMLTDEQEQRERAQAELAIEQARLNMHRLTAPFAGVIVRLTVDEGATVSRTDPIVHLVKLDELKATIYVPAERYGQFKTGQVYTLAAGQPVNRELQATLKLIDPLIDSASGMFRCVFTIDNADEALPGGFPVRLKLE